MLEKIFGRKTNPDVRPNHSEDYSQNDKRWWIDLVNSPEFKDWFSGSVVADNDGIPFPVYHGTRGVNEPWEVYEIIHKVEWGAHFGTIAAANDRLAQTFENEHRTLLEEESARENFNLARYLIKNHPELSDEEREKQLAELDEMEEPANMEKYRQEKSEQLKSRLVGGERIYPVFLKIQNPVRISDPGAIYELNLEKIKHDLGKNFLTRAQSQQIRNVENVQELRNSLIEMGFDGVVYTNTREGLLDGIPVHDSYIPLVGKEQIWPCFENEPLSA